MGSQSSCHHAFSALLLILGLSISSGNAAESVQTDCPTPVAGPKPACPGSTPVAPPRRIDPEEYKQAERAQRQADAEYQARPKPVPETGIIPVRDGIDERLGRGHFVENRWYQIVNGLDINVFAGAMRYDPADDSIKYDLMTAHGFVVIDKGEPGEPGFRTSRVYTPAAVGSLRIVSAKGMVLTLQSRQGNKYLLNVKTEQLTPLGNHGPRPR